MTIKTIEMKYILTGLLLYGLICQGQDTTTYTWFKNDFMNTTGVLQDYNMQIKNDPMFKPALILLGTFAINQILITVNENDKYFNTGLVTGSVFVLGGGWSLYAFSKELKKQKKVYEKFGK